MNDYSIQQLEPVWVDELPDGLERDRLYLEGPREDPSFGTFLCPCECGDSIGLNFVGKSPRWSLHFLTPGEFTITPSVRRVVRCQSHFYVRRNRIVWCHSAGEEPVPMSATRGADKNTVAGGELGRQVVPVAAERKVVTPEEGSPNQIANIAAVDCCFASFAEGTAGPASLSDRTFVESATGDSRTPDPDRDTNTERKGSKDDSEPSPPSCFNGVQEDTTLISENVASEILGEWKR